MLFTEERCRAQNRANKEPGLDTVRSNSLNLGSVAREGEAPRGERGNGSDGIGLRLSYTAC